VRDGGFERDEKRGQDGARGLASQKNLGLDATQARKRKGAHCTLTFQLADYFIGCFLPRGGRNLGAIRRVTRVRIAIALAGVFFRRDESRALDTWRLIPRSRAREVARRSGVCPLYGVCCYETREETICRREIFRGIIARSYRCAPRQRKTRRDRIFLECRQPSPISFSFDSSAGERGGWAGCWQTRNSVYELFYGRIRWKMRRFFIYCDAATSILRSGESFKIIQRLIV